jgi:hypothetical protein
MRKKNSKRIEENFEASSIALFLAIAAIIIGIAAVVFLWHATKAVDQAAFDNHKAQSTELVELRYCIDNDVKPCPPTNDDFWKDK